MTDDVLDVQPSLPETPDAHDDGVAEAPSLTATLRFPVASEAPAASDGDGPEATPSAAAPAAPPEPPHLRDVLATCALWAGAVPRRVGQAFSRHRLIAIAAVLACVGLAIAGTLYALHGMQTPPDSLIDGDARERLAAPTPAASDYALDEPLVPVTFDIRAKKASPSRRDACDVTLDARFANEGVEATATATLTYVREADGSWSCTAARMDEVSYRATAGVSADTVVAQLAALLRAAGSDEDEGDQLAALYDQAGVELVGEHFNEELQTDALTLHCASGTAFMSRECDLTVHFRFVPASGAWELMEARVSEGALDLGFQPLVGTWSGTFLSQKAKGGKCLAAREVGLELVILKASVNKDGVALIEGTCSGLAHLHDPVATDVEAHQDDELLDSVPFAGTLRTASGTGGTEGDLLALLTGTDASEAPGSIVFDCVTQDLAHGSVSLSIDLGAGDDPDGAVATLTSLHPYQETFALFWTYDATARFEDRFALTKVS